MEQKQKNQSSGAVLTFSLVIIYGLFVLNLLGLGAA